MGTFEEEAVEGATAGVDGEFVVGFRCLFAVVNFLSFLSSLGVCLGKGVAYTILFPHARHTIPLIYRRHLIPSLIPHLRVPMLNPITVVVAALDG